MFKVIELRSGRIRSRHTTEALAFAAIDRIIRRMDRAANKPGMQGGGYGNSLELAVMEVKMSPNLDPDALSPDPDSIELERWENEGGQAA